MSTTPSEPSRSPPGATFFSRFLCRVGGLSPRVVGALRAGRALAVVEELLRAEARLQECREPLTDLLHEEIGRTPEGRHRHALIALRRNIHNLRPLQPAHLAPLPEGLRGEVERYLHLHEQLVRQRKELETLLEEETLEARRHLREALRDDSFQKALLLSSRSLFREQRRYLQTDPSELRARQRKHERGLLRYLTRMAMKATPFATFCAILPGSMEEGTGAGTHSPPPLRFEGNPLHEQGHVRLNKAYYGILVQHLAQNPAVRRRFQVLLNPTISQEGAGTLRFLSMVAGRETFQRIRASPVLEVISGLVTGGERGPSLRELLEALLRHPELDASEEEVSAYVARLLEVGFLLLSTGIPSQELDWDRALCELLDGVEDEQALEVVSLLRQLRELVDAYGSASLEERASLLERMEARYESFREDMGIPVHVNVPIFEDASAPGAAIVHRSDGLRRIERKLSEYVDLTSRLSLQRRDLANMRHFFESHYGARVEAVPLLRFYEDYYRQHYKEHLERERNAGKPRPPGAEDTYNLENPFGLELVERLMEARKRLTDFLSERWVMDGKEGTLALTLEQLRELLGDMAPLPDRSGWSVSVFGELVGPAGEGNADVQLVLRSGGYFIGFGKMFSRFLYVLPVELEQALRDNNERMTRHTLAELCDDANFNANLHPPLLPEEISYPVGASRGGGSHIAPTEILVVRDPLDANALHLRHARTGRRVLPVDTGFMSLEARPPLYKLLVAFTPAPSFMLPIPSLPHEPGASKEPRVLPRPRITLGGLVLARRSWLVPDSLYPHKQPSESEAAFFLRLARWRRELGIPQEVYVRLQPRADSSSEPDVAPQEGEATLRRSDAYKPQYVDFGSPLLVNLFDHMVPEQGGFVAILEERLPGEEALFRHEGTPLVSELILQLDFPETSEA